MVGEGKDLFESLQNGIVPIVGAMPFCIINEPDSILMVYSNKVLEEAKSDSWRYDSSLWLDCF